MTAARRQGGGLEGLPPRGGGGPPRVGGVTPPETVAAIADPYERVQVARAEIEVRQAEIAVLGRLRAEAVAGLLAAGVKATEVAARLGVHPSYVYQLAKPARRG